MARQPVPVSKYDAWLKEQHDAYAEATANVERIDRDIAQLTAQLDALFMERVEEVALRDHASQIVQLDPSEFRERAKHGQWRLEKRADKQ